MIRAAAASWRAAIGWGFCAVLGAVLLSLLAAPPPRQMPAFAFPEKVPLGEMGTLSGAPADIVGEGGWHLPATCRYRLLPGGGAAAAADVEVLATYFVSPRTDACKYPELYATCPWQPPAAKNSPWAEHATQHADSSGGAWMQIDDAQGVYLVARVAPDGNCTSTEEQFRHHEIDQWRRHPWHPLRWLFSAQPDVDQRAVWVRLTVSRRVDGAPRPPEDIARLWESVRAAFSEQARRAWGEYNEPRIEHG